MKRHMKTPPWMAPSCGPATFIARTLGVLGIAATLSACGNGYPQNDASLVSPVTMSQKQRLAAMNAVGKLHYLEERWRYKLNDACELKISTGSWLNRHHSAWVPLASAQVVKRFDKSDKTHDIFLHPTQPSSSGPSSVPLMTGANWEDAVQLMSLAQFMQRECLQRS